MTQPEFNFDCSYLVLDIITAMKLKNKLMNSEVKRVKAVTAGTGNE